MQVLQEVTTTVEPKRPTKSKRPSSEKKKKSKSKTSGVRSKFVIESLRKDYFALKEENERLRGLVKENLPIDVSENILSLCALTKAQKVSVESIDSLTAQMEETGMDDEEAQ